MRRFFPPLVVLSLLACFGMTAWVHWGKATWAEAGAIRQYDLWRGQYWRAIAAIFLHGSWLHLFINAIGIVLLGSSIRNGLGARAYLVAVFAGSWAAFGASMLWLAEDPYRVGISGGLTAMLGLVVAVEWRNCGGRLGKFLRSRTMILLLVVVVASIGLTLMLADAAGRPDHAGHAGGFVFGILWGLAQYPKLRADGADTPERPLFGGVALALFAVAPLAYASYPLHDVEFCLFKAGRADRAGKERTAILWYERSHARDPDRLQPRLRLAALKLDVSYLDGVSPALPLNQRAVVGVYFSVIQRLNAEEREKVPPALHRHILDLARRAKWNPNRRWNLALDSLKLPDPTGKSPREHLADLQALAGRLLEATGGLASEQPEKNKAALRKFFSELLTGMGAATATLAGMPEPPAGLTDLHGALAAVYRRLANNPGAAALGEVAVWRYQFAHYTHLAAGDPAVARAYMAAALQDAREGGHQGVETAVTRWLKAHGFPVPAPDLAPRDGGG